MAEPDVVVVGGGLAGIAAALRGGRRRPPSLLFESRPRLGGAAFSFRRGELSVDNGQHVFLRCCAAYRWLLDRMGAGDKTVLQAASGHPGAAPGRAHGAAAADAGRPAPAHLSAALATYGLLSPADRLAAVRGALALRMLDPRDRSLDTRTLGEFLRRHGQTPKVIDALWGIVATATLNIDPDARLARAGGEGLPHRPARPRPGRRRRLRRCSAGRAALARPRALRWSAQASRCCRGTASSLWAPTGRSRCAIVLALPCWPRNTVVLAVPPRDAFRIAPALARHPCGAGARAADLADLNVHVVYDRPVTAFPFAAAVGSPVQWIFDRTRLLRGARDASPGAQYLAVTVSAADELIDLPSAVLRERFLTELAGLLPRARSATVLDSFVTRERHATFRQESGSAALRPGSDSGVDGRLAGRCLDRHRVGRTRWKVRSAVVLRRPRRR